MQYNVTILIALL